MKYYSATEARTLWFRILDEVAEGEQVVIERKGQRIVICREEAPAYQAPNYESLLKVPADEEADSWSWEWRPEGGLDFKAP